MDKENKIPKTIRIPIWYNIIDDGKEGDGEIVIDREEMVDALERAIGELEDKLNQE